MFNKQEPSLTPEKIHEALEQVAILHQENPFLSTKVERRDETIREVERIYSSFPAYPEIVQPMLNWWWSQRASRLNQRQAYAELLAHPEAYRKLWTIKRIFPNVRRQKDVTLDTCIVLYGAAHMGEHAISAAGSGILWAYLDEPKWETPLWAKAKALVLSPGLRSLAQHGIGQTARMIAQTYSDAQYRSMVFASLRDFAVGLFSHPVIGPDEMRFEIHSHTHYSDGVLLDDIVDALFDKNVEGWSLTDHNNSYCFDDLFSGSRKIAGKRQYKVHPHEDGRSLSITAKGHELVLLRSIEYMAQEGEIGIHGYKGHMPLRTLPITQATQEAMRLGGMVVLHHIGYHNYGVGSVSREPVIAAKNAGATAIELNAFDPLFLFSAADARKYAHDLDMMLVPGGDAHTVDMYGRSCIIFNKKEYYRRQEISRSHAQAFNSMIKEGLFRFHYRPITPVQVIKHAAKF